MKWISPAVTQHFQSRIIWGEGNAGWSSGAPRNGTVQNTFSGVDSPSAGSAYTVAWFAYFKVETRAYTKSDENTSDNNIYLQVNITTVHNKVWTSNVAPVDGFIDIGLIAWNPNRQNDHLYTTGVYLYDQESSKAQLYNWLGLDGNNVVCGVVADNGNRTGQTIPGGPWGSHPGGVDTPVGTRTFTLTFGSNDFNSDGSLKAEKRVLPFCQASRWHMEDPSQIGMSVDPTLNIDLTVEPFIYIPWGIKKSNGYQTCNRLPDGLMVHKGGSWSKVVKNSFMSRVVGNSFPSTSNGFRIHSNKWEVSPLTPDD